MGGVPKGWRRLSKMGKVIEGTTIVAFKGGCTFVAIHITINRMQFRLIAPLSSSITGGLQKSERFDLKDVLNAFPTIGLVIDLTKTMRYYDPAALTQEGVEYKKLICEGFGVLPTDAQIAEVGLVFCGLHVTATFCVDSSLRSSANMYQRTRTN